MNAAVARLLDDAARDLAACADAGDARRDAQVLLGFALGVSRAWLAAHGDDIADAEAAARFRALVSRRLAGEPVAYLIGTREFYGLSFRVTPAVLIPRPETEVLVEAALERLPERGLLKVLDLGTGSGCVAVAIAHERRDAQVTAAERSGDALALARENARALGAQVEFLESDWFAALPGRTFDLIVSNPPYVAAADAHLEQGDLRFEPRAALAAGADGLEDIRRIVGQAPRHLRQGGWLLFEHGCDQAQACRDLLRDTGFGELISRADLAGMPRVAGGRLLTRNSPNR